MLDFFVYYYATVMATVIGFGLYWTITDKEGK